MNQNVLEFLRESNAIEREYSQIALEDAQLAWNYAINNKPAVTIDYILEIHRLLMRRLWPDIAGKFRTENVYIGHSKKIFISRVLFCAQLQKLVCEPMSDPKYTDPIKVHVNFEEIHPFLDGNGRTGRILYNIHRLKLNLPIHIIHEGAEQFDYYKWFK